MSIPLTFVAVILIWSTTPLAVQWSSSTIPPVTSLAWRMVAAWLLIFVAQRLFSKDSLEIKSNWKSYAAASLGVFPGMQFVYLAAQYIPSGLIAVIFGLSVFGNAIFARLLLHEKSMSYLRYIALLISLIGLTVITSGQGDLTGNMLTGVLLTLAAVLVTSLSSVLTKRYGVGIRPISQLNGTLLFSLPWIFSAWLIVDGFNFEEITIDTRSLLAMVYLTVIATIVGFSLYYSLLQRVSAVTVGLMPLLTPALAIWFGSLLNHESITRSLVLGTLMITLGLGLFNLGALRKWLAGRRSST